MATVNGLTAERMMAIEAGSVVDGAIVGDDLILTKHDGSTINAGGVRGNPGVNGTNAMAGRRWSPGTSYAVGDTVGYGGAIWTALYPSTDKCPPYYSGYWTSLTGYDVTSWFQADPYFTSDDLGANWQIFWKTGTSVASLTSAASEFESGHQALKVALAANSTQRLYDYNENMVASGETIVTKVRAKLTAAVTGAYLETLLFQSGVEGPPEPFGVGSTQFVSPTGKLTPTTSWQTFTFEIIVPFGKPRSRINVIVGNAAAPATVVIDSIRSYRKLV